MIDTLYIEEAIMDAPRVQIIKERFAKARVIPCERYTEVFNRKAQNFRLQKENPALILAEKQGKLLHPTPKNYDIGSPLNFYFAHLLNCPFDCSYCFLQGMYRSAHYVLFVNFEAFQKEIENTLAQNPGREITFFSGYDGDSLALESITGFAQEFIPFFAKQAQALLEIRTKSARIKPLLNMQPIPNAVIAYSLNPECICKAFEQRASSLKARLHCLKQLQEAGWKLGLRFDPLIDHPDYQAVYSAFFQQVFDLLCPDAIHSITLGAFRLPKPIFRNMVRLKPRDPLLALCDEKDPSMASFPKNRESGLLAFCKQEILKRAPENKLFICSG